MSIFPTKILLATDGSKEASLALTTAADMAQSTNSELHLAYVFPTAVQRPFPNPITSRPHEVLEHELEEAMQQAQHFLDQQVDRVKQEGVSVAEAHLVRGRPDREVVHLRFDHPGKQGFRGSEAGFDGQCLRLCGPPRSLSRPDSARVGEQITA
jgi:hypothetical protein